LLFRRGVRGTNHSIAAKQKQDLQPRSLATTLERTMPSETDNKTALVLAGGGSLGAVQVGMLKALVTAGVTADFVVGSSVGAVNGAY
jgi:predicted acylesterase/phospholipase RssA